MSIGRAPDHGVLRVSLFVDGENVSPTHWGAILDIAQSYGTADFMRAYGNASILPKWEATSALRLIHLGSGKNAADLQLTVQAMERALTNACDVIVVATSDGDFSHLAIRLRELGFLVVGVGKPKALRMFTQACSRFHTLKVDAAPSPNVASNSINDKVLRLLKKHDAPSGGLGMNRLGSLMNAEYQTAATALKEATWSGYLKARPQLFVVTGEGGSMKVKRKVP